MEALKDFKIEILIKYLYKDFHFIHIPINSYTLILDHVRKYLREGKHMYISIYI